jgi:hypothetical protein
MGLSARPPSSHVPGIAARGPVVRALVAAAVGACLQLVGAGSAAAGKPGYPDRVTWSGLSWQVKTSRSAVGPGPNVFDRSNVWVDASGYLHLRVARNGSGTWTAAEIIGPVTHGYGTYTFVLGSRVDALDPNVVLGLFTWSDRAIDDHREIDIEFARWGDGTDPTNGQYVVQPWSTTGHLLRFTQPAVTTSTHQFTWVSGRIAWRSTDGGGGPISSHEYAASDVPRSKDERVRLNLWLFSGAAPTDGNPTEVIVRSFAFAR